jgi:hypothetical protein
VTDSFLIENSVLDRGVRLEDEIFPNISFVTSGPSLDWLKNNSCLPVRDYKPHDHFLEKLEGCEPYIDGDCVFVVGIRKLSQEELRAREFQRAQEQRVSMNVSPLQAMAALLQTGRLAEVEAVINDPQTDPLIKLAWNRANEFRRLSPLVVKMQQQLAWSDEYIDQLFRFASEIQV